MNYCAVLAVTLGLFTATTDALGEHRDRYDIVIAGAGTGGCGAAIQAARLGVSVLLLEETDWIGGQMNAAAVTSMDEGETLVRERGLYREFVEHVQAFYTPLGKSAETAYWGRHIGFEPRVGRRILETMLEDARGSGVLDLVLRSRVIRVLRQGDTVTGVEVETVSPEGKQTRKVQCRVLVDATEWGDVIPLTGARYRVGNCTNEAVDPERKIQMLTWTAVIKQYPKGVPPGLLLTTAPPGYTEKVRQYFTKTLIDGTAISYKDKPWTMATFIGYRAMPDSSRPGDWPPVTRTHMNFNNDYEVRIGDVEDPARRQATCREARLKTLHLLYYLQSSLGKKDWSVANDEGFDSPFNREQIDEWLKERPDLAPYRQVLNHFSVMAYARESRRIVGLYTLTAGDIDRRSGAPRAFPTTVAVGDYAVDLHGSKTPSLLEPGLDRPEDIPGAFGDHGHGPFGIPLESFIPETLDGFLAAEKNISQSRLANGATRLQPSTMLMGQAAGCIAALAVKHGVRPRGLDPVLVQSVLLDSRDTLLTTPLKDIAREGWEWKPIQLVTVHGMLLPGKGRFAPEKVITDAELRTIGACLFNKPLEPAGKSITRGAFAAAMQKAAGESPVTIDPIASVADPDRPLTRLDAAQMIAGYLEARAMARTTGTSQTLSWPKPRSVTPLSSGDGDPRLMIDLQRLVARKVITDTNYWREHAEQGEQCDGDKVADLIVHAAKAFQPAKNLKEATDVLARHNVIGRPDYWLVHAVAGKRCDGGLVATLIRNLAVQLKTIPRR
jgi:hypothetical protein